jgi:hypothetical protein
MESEGIASNILNLSTGWKTVVRFTLQPLYLMLNIPQYLSDRKLDKEYRLKLFSLPGIRIPIHHHNIVSY